MAGYTQLLDVFSNTDGREMRDDDLASLEAEIRHVRGQRNAAISLCATLFRGVNMQATRPFNAETIFVAAKAEYDELLKSL